MNSLTSGLFWKAAAERAAVVFAYTLASLIGFGAIAISRIDWIPDLEISASATLLSVLHAVASTRPIVVPGTPAANPPSEPVSQLQSYSESASAK